MKIIISESRRDELAFNYLMKELGEFVETPNDDQLGFYMKEGSFTGKVVSSLKYKKLLFVQPRIRFTVMNLFSLNERELRKLVQDRLGIRLVN